MTQLLAQNTNKDYILPLKTGDRILKENIQKTNQTKKLLNQQVFRGKSYVLLQFHQLPDVETHQKVKLLGIDLTEYIAGSTYRATIPKGLDVATLATLGVRAVDRLTAIEKIDPVLLSDNRPEHVVTVRGNLDIQLRMNDGASVEKVKAALRGFQVEYLEEEQSYNSLLQIRIPQEEIESIADMPFVNYIHPVEGEHIELGGGRGTSIRSDYLNKVDGLYGENVIAGVFESGAVDHIDLRNAIEIDSHYDCGTHAEMVAGMLGAQGILRPTSQGVAPKVDIRKFTAGITDARLQTYTGNKTGSEKMVLTNQSYVGGDIGNVDQQHLTHEELMQVVAAGNRGVTIPFIPKYGTVYGGAHSAKNSLTVGGIDVFNRIIEGYDNGSSKGPTLDGRLKPELVAIAGRTPDNVPGNPPMAPAPSITNPSLVYSEDNHLLYCQENNYAAVVFGTSFAAPQVAGGLALLYEYYREENGGANPKGAFMKAIACNTADDLGNPGPDFAYGFGKMNLRKAKKALEEGWHHSNTFLAGADPVQDAHTFNGINISAGDNYHQLKVMLYWPDQPSTAAWNDTNPRLINNLDLVVNTPSGIQRFPLILDPTEGNETLNAVEGVDNLNNVEQVVITADNAQFLEAGQYTVEVSPTSVAMEDQPYYIVWEFIEPGITVTSPYPDEVMARVGANNYDIEWDYYGYQDDATSSFRITITDSSGNELHSDDDIGGEVRTYRWKKCDMFNINMSDLKIKIERLDATGTVRHFDESTFSVYNTVSKLIVNDAGNGQASLSWNMECAYVGDDTPPIDGIPPVYFTVYQYDEAVHDMLPIHTTSDYSATLDFDENQPEIWYAVSTTYHDAGGQEVETTRSKAQRFLTKAECSPLIFVNQTDVSGDYNAADYIQTNINLTVNTGENLEVSGTNRVRLHKGFSVKQGATFRADNEDCN